MKRGPSILAERLGQSDADTVSAKVGGTRLHVPGRLANMGRLEELFGWDIAVKLVLHFGDSRFYVPMTARAERGSIDRRKLKRLLSRGWSTPRIARELKCSERTIEMIKASNTNRPRSTPQHEGN